MIIPLEYLKLQQELEERSNYKKVIAFLQNETVFKPRKLKRALGVSRDVALQILQRLNNERLVVGPNEGLTGNRYEVLRRDQATLDKLQAQIGNQLTNCVVRRSSGDIQAGWRVVGYAAQHKFILAKPMPRSQVDPDIENRLILPSEFDDFIQINQAPAAIEPARASERKPAKPKKNSELIYDKTAGFAGGTNAGKIRPEDEDYIWTPNSNNRILENNNEWIVSGTELKHVLKLMEILAKHEIRLSIVADGMGGHSNGKLASKMATQYFVTNFLQREHIEQIAQADQDPQQKFNEKAFCLDIKTNAHAYLRDAMKSVNNIVFENLTGAGTTLVATLIDGQNKAIIANVGDSRAYLIGEQEKDGAQITKTEEQDATRTDAKNFIKTSKKIKWQKITVKRKSIAQLTTDHTLPAQLLERGSITPAEAAVHSQRHQLTRSIGDELVKVDVYEIQLKPGDKVLSACDGMQMIADSEILRIIAQNADLGDTVVKLINAANKAGGRDNISVVLLETGEIKAHPDTEADRVLA